MGENQPHFQFSIKKIKDIYFFINEELAIPGKIQGVKVEMQYKMGYHKEQNLLNLILIIFLHYNEQPPDKKLSEIHVQNLFEVNNIAQYIDKNDSLILPHDILASIFSMSISHSRALFYKNVAGTFLQDAILPVTDLIGVLRHFFPEQYPEVENQEADIINSKPKEETGLSSNRKIPKKKIATKKTTKK
jgi:hypothetical protein